MWMCSHISRVISTRVLIVAGDGGGWLVGNGRGVFQKEGSSPEWKCQVLPIIRTQYGDPGAFRTRA